MLLVSWVLWAVWYEMCVRVCRVGGGIHILPAIYIQSGLVSGLAMLSHISRSVALSMLGYSCLAHSYWQRCHKRALQGAISSEELTGGGANQERTICMSSSLLPLGSPRTSLTSLHYALIFLRLAGHQTSSSCQFCFFPRKNVRLEEYTRKQLVEL